MACTYSCPSGYTYVASRNQCATPMRGPSSHVDAYNDCANVIDFLGANTANNGIQFCPYTGNCAAINDWKYVWERLTSSGGGSMRCSKINDLGIGNSFLIYPPDICLGFFQNPCLEQALDTCDNTHYYWCVTDPKIT